MGTINLELEIKRTRDGDVCWIGYRLDGEDPADMSNGTARNLDEAVQALLAEKGELEALGLWRESFCGAPLPQNIAADGWVNVYD